MTATPFEELEAEYQSAGPQAALEQLALRMRDKQDYHALFDIRLMQARQRLELPIILATPLEDLAEPLRGEVEAAYLAACREAGWLLWKEGKFREAWMYLRPLGENGAVAEALRQIESNEENLGTLLEIALHEGVAPAYGFDLVLRHYGTCNSITTFDTEMARHSRPQQQLAAGSLVRQLHADLLLNLRADVERKEAAAPVQSTVQELVAGRDWLFADNSYHVDASHLSAVVRIARLVEDPEVLKIAWDLTDYGRLLGPTFQTDGDAPFEDFYPSQGLFFAAQLGRQVDEGVAYFRGKAERTHLEDEGTAAAEVYVVLLIRLGRFAEALDEHVRLMPSGARTMGFAPTFLELAQLAKGYDRLLDVCRQRGDLLGFAAGLLSKRATEQ